MGQAVLCQDDGGIVIIRLDEATEEIKRRLNGQVASFIETGYYIKLVRDNMLYREGGYSDIYAFAYGEFGLSTSTTDRYMAINTRFSKGGNSIEIRDEYREFKRSCLQEMLNMDEADIGVITPGMSVRDIREIKKTEREDEAARKEAADKNLPLVTMSGGTGDAPERRQGIGHLAGLFARDRGEDFRRKVMSGVISEPDDIYRLINPGNGTVYRTNEAPQQYILFLSLEKGIRYRDCGEEIRMEEYTYRQFYGILREACGTAENTEPVEEEPAAAKEAAEPAKEPAQAAGNTATETGRQETEQYEPLPGQTTMETWIDERRKTELMGQISETIQRINRLERNRMYKVMRNEAKTLSDRLVMLAAVMEGEAY